MPDYPDDFRMNGINSTYAYYRNQPIDLLTEFTVCESLADINSPAMILFDYPATYGQIVGAKLRACGLLRPGSRLCEAGGGYGSLMKGLLGVYQGCVKECVMIDISPSLLAIQREALREFSSFVSFVHGDITELLPGISAIDCLIVNEVAGDLEVLTDIAAARLPRHVKKLVERYELEIPQEGTFHFNIGAICLVEALCERGIPAFISEHACDFIIPPDMPYLARGLDERGYPREIKLKGHSEYTIRFSHLMAVASWWGRDVLTGSMLELLGIRHTPKLRFIFLARASSTDEQQVIFEFLDHAREYRWLIIR